MFNKTDTAKSDETDKRTSLITSTEIPNNIVELPSKFTNKGGDNFYINSVKLYFKRLSLGTKATMLAIAIGTVPVLVIGAIAYNFANKSITQQITQAQEQEAISLGDKINRFMFERYGDIQVLSNLPILNNGEVKNVTTVKQKQAVLRSFCTDLQSLR